MVGGRQEGVWGWGWGYAVLLVDEWDEVCMCSVHVQCACAVLLVDEWEEGWREVRVDVRVDVRMHVRVGVRVNGRWQVRTRVSLSTIGPPWNCGPRVAQYLFASPCS